MALFEEALEVVRVVEAAVAPDLENRKACLCKLPPHFSETRVQNVFEYRLFACLAKPEVEETSRHAEMQGDIIYTNAFAGVFGDVGASSLHKHGRRRNVGG